MKAVSTLSRRMRFVGLSHSRGMPALSVGFRALPVGVRGFCADPTKPGEKAAESKVSEENKEEDTKSETVSEEPVAAESSKMVEVEEKVLAQKDAEIREFKEKYLRSLAEIDNVRRRSQLDISTFKKYAISKFAGDLLVIADNLGMALKNTETSGAVELMDNDNDESRALKTLYDGLVITNKALKHAFESHNIKQIESAGQKFDPNLHEVLFEVPDPEKDAGTIVSIVKEGFTLHDRVLRAAQVGTVKAK